MNMPAIPGKSQIMNRNILNGEATILEALGRLNELSGTSMTLFVVDGEGVMLGTLTDGDIRRGLLDGLSLDAPAREAVHNRFKALKPTDDENQVALLRSYREQGITLVPRLDPSGRIEEIVDLKRTRNKLPITAILMAGGKGERLRPLTLTCPKPLLEIEGKAIIDYNIEALATVGVKDISVTTRYLAEQIATHFEKPVAGVEVKCVEETAPLGTIGSAALVERPAEGDTLIMNSDLITSISFEDLYLRHKDTEADITIAVVPYQVAVPFAILDLDGEMVTGLKEKPLYSYYANAGIYIFSNKVLNTLRADERTDATDLIERTIAAGGKVTYYPIKGTWIDVGSPVDFKQAAELMRHHKSLLTKN